MRNLDEVLESLDTSAKRIAEQRSPSRFVDLGASPEYAEEVAKMHGGRRDYKLAPEYGHASGGEFLRDVALARFGDARAAARLSKSWIEGTPSAGGFFVPPQLLPGYVEAMRAAAPLRARCTQIDARSDEVWIVVEGNSVQVAHTAESATKLDTTGSVAQKTATNHKVAGTSHISDELIADSGGNAEQLISSQFAKAIGIAIDSAIISGTGVGQPTGILNAAGVASQAVDGQDGQALYESILLALNRISERFEQADTVVVHPRDVVKVDLAKTTTNEYVFAGGLGAHLPDGVDLVLDANLPATRGAGSNESVILVGGFKRGAFCFSRQPLTIDASRHAAWSSDETVYRGVERYGFALVVPGAFEILSGIQP